jgi:hypothetical protein
MTYLAIFLNFCTRVHCDEIHRNIDSKWRVTMPVIEPSNCHEYLMRHSLKSGGTKDHFRWIKLPHITSRRPEIVLDLNMHEIFTFRCCETTEISTHPNSTQQESNYIYLYTTKFGTSIKIRLNRKFESTEFETTRVNCILKLFYSGYIWSVVS